MNSSTYYIGASYYPEWWARERWAEDFSKMQAIGFNCVRMGEFAWADVEPEPGRYTFEWMKEAIDLASSYGISTMLCTSTATQPAWLREMHPDILGGNHHGPFSYGARKGYCTNSPGLLEHTDRLVEAMASYFADTSNIVAWQLDNEPGYPFICFDENCQCAFQNWLKERYGSLESLNQAWNTSFWSHRYSDWTQIEIPVNGADGRSWHPGIRLDYRRFFSSSFSSYLRRQAHILKSHIPTCRIFTNWPNTFWSIDVFEAADDFLDATAWDNYNDAPGISDYRNQFHSALHHDLCRCAGPHQRFLIAEQASQVPAVANNDGIYLQTYLDLAHGSGGTIFFQWRAPIGGQEQGYISVLQMDGSYGPAKNQYVRLTSEFAILAPKLAETRIESEVALIYDYPSSWNKGFWKQNRCWAKAESWTVPIYESGDGYDSVALKWYKGMKRLNANLDVIPLNRELSSYKMIVAPCLEVISDSDAEALLKYVEKGGVLVINTGAGTRLPDNRLREMVSPGIFGEAAGLRVERTVNRTAMAGNLIHGLPDETGVVGYKIDLNGQHFEPASTIDEIIANDVEILASLSGGRLEGKPAVTLNSYGKGTVVFAGVDCNDVTFYEELCEIIGKRAGVSPILDVPTGCSIVSRVDSEQEFLFLINLLDKEQTLVIPEEMKDAITDELLSGKMVLPPLHTRVLERPRLNETDFSSIDLL